MSTDELHLINIPSELSETEFTEMISINIICRLCANQSDKLIGIYSEDGVNNDLSGKMNLYLPVKVSESDNLPLQCCWQCASTLLAWHELVVTSVEADRRLRSYQFVTEKQLVEITSYGGTELLANNTDENLQPDTKNNEAGDNTKCSENQTTSLDVSKTTGRNNQNTGLITKESAITNKGHYPENLNEELTRSTEFSENEDTDSQLHVNNAKAKDSTNKNVKCNICETIFSSKPELEKHPKTIHIIKGIKTRRKKCDIVAAFKCSHCNKSYTRKHDLKKHTKIKHPHETLSQNIHTNANIINSCKKSTSEGLVYQCDFCSRSFKKSYSLSRHRTIHLNYRPYCCDLCGKKFRLSSSLIRHINEFHHNNRNFKCTLCDKVFKNKCTRDEHMNIHDDVRPYVCDICGKSFRQSASLYVHKRFHTNIFPYQCNVCDKRFRTKQHYTQHSLLHTGYKPYHCQKCNMSFKSEKHINSHYKCHMPVSCDKCGDTFGQVRYMKLHKRRCRYSLEESSEKNIIEHISPVEEGKSVSEGVILKN